MIEKIASEFGSLRPTVERTATSAVQSNPSAGDFASMLVGMLSQTVSQVQVAEQAAIDGLHRKVPVQEVVEKVMTAEQSLQAAIAVRDKVVAAYLEISRMNI